MLDLSAVPELLAKLAGNPRDIVLMVLLLSAAAIDWRTRRIPNWLVLAGAAFGLVYNFAAGGVMSGLLAALAGLALGLVLLLPLYALRVMGAGDVKLMAAVGAIVGATGIVYAVVCTFIAGGIAALLFALYHRAVRRMTGNVVEIVQHMAFAAIAGVRPAATATRVSVGKLPYAVSIAAGTLGWRMAQLAGFA